MLVSFESVNRIRYDSWKLSLLRRVARRVGDPIDLVNVDRARRFAYTGSERQHGVIFVHIPKSAGNSIVEGVFGARDSSHATLSKYHVDDPELYAQSYKFAVVRNPWDRFVSAFFYLSQGGNNPADVWARDAMLQGVGFSGFVARLGRDRGFRKRVLNQVHFVPQSVFLTGPGDTTVDDLFRLEDLGAAEETLSERLNREVRFPVTNTSTRKDYREVFTDQSEIELVAELYAEDIARFGYDFEAIA